MNVTILHIKETSLKTDEGNVQRITYRHDTCGTITTRYLPVGSIDTCDFCEFRDADATVIFQDGDRAVI